MRGSLPRGGAQHRRSEHHRGGGRLEADFAEGVSCPIRWGRDTVSVKESAPLAEGGAVGRAGDAQGLVELSGFRLAEVAAPGK